ncbi:hypothetical protein G4Y79_14875 [Phototrophicus methaneseepsis]|uniref:Uncharacterized protein n=1 Tax=Phototrophicus methaneseepsis TaxID=2710758 RepID=A0A7S8E5X5_9CHLR|nr:hypothetical protein [Phototrophicus methaneseepsis]QPC80987.1 hypothetical protein G4Y79_14875 [Phototrophicus methaneseepsis]
MSREAIAILGLVIFGLIFGYFTSRSSQKREAIYSGPIAQVFHYLASSLLCTLTPTILVSVIVLHVGFIRAVLIALAMFILALILLLPYALLEKPAIEDREKQDDRGWTREDAISSGL